MGRRAAPRRRWSGRGATWPAALAASAVRHPWARSTALLLAAAAAAGGLFSAESWLRAALGATAPLVPLWLGWMALLALPRPGLPRPGRQLLAEAGLLSLAALPLASLAGAGGWLGAELRLNLERLLGGNGATFVLLLAVAAAPLAMLGPRRERLARWAGASWRKLAARRAAGRRPWREQRSRPRLERRPDPPASPRSASPRARALGPAANAASSQERELLILGPDGQLITPTPRLARRPAAAGTDHADSSPLSSAAGGAQRAAAPPAASSPPRRASTPAPAASTSRPASPAPGLDSPPPAAWQLPSLELLSAGRESTVSPLDLKAQARIIEQTLETFHLPVRVVEVRQGPTVSQFGVEPAPGVAVDRVAARAHDLALRLGARSIRIQAPIPGRPLMGIEVPNGEAALVSLRETLQQGGPLEQHALPVALGKDTAGQAVVVDLARLPHLLVAGATGSGKSVGLNALLMSLLLTRTPDQAQFILVDPKRVELTAYSGVPHLRMPVLTEMELVLGALRWALEELESRFARFAQATCRNLESFNQRQPPPGRLPRLVIVVDELADLMMTVPDEVERCLCRLAQLGRAAGIHLVVATQRPSVDVLTGLIKANFPARVAFAVTSLVDSRVVLDQAGAEQLLGRGDMLFQAPDAARPRRIQGTFVDERELRQVVAHWRRQGGPRFGEDVQQRLADLGRQALADPEDELLARARELAEAHDNVSASFLQRRLGIGYARAARLMQRLRQLEDDESAAPARA